MAHLPPSNTIFSPSVARIVASTAKDWNYVDSWLSTKFHGRSPPPFERNPDTLKVLLALASLNESADEERDMVARADADALAELRQSSPPPPPISGPTPASASEPAAASTPQHLGDAILSIMERNLPRDGAVALDALSAVATTLGLANPEPELLARRMLSLQASAFELDQARARVDVLARFVAAESARADSLLAELRGPGYRPAPDLAKQNLDAQRRVRAAAARLPEMRDRVSALAAAAAASPHPTIEQVAGEESEYLALLAERRELESQLAYFAGLPPDPDAARLELEDLRSRLLQVTAQRDAGFEGLVEREHPKRRP